MADPRLPPVVPSRSGKCDYCFAEGFANCDVDYEYRYGCTRCSGEGRPCQSCGEPLAHRHLAPPELEVELQRCCEPCSKAMIKGSMTCSWLRDKRDRTGSCSRCSLRNYLCIWRGAVFKPPEIALQEPEDTANIDESAPPPPSNNEQQGAMGWTSRLRKIPNRGGGSSRVDEPGEGGDGSGPSRKRAARTTGRGRPPSSETLRKCHLCATRRLACDASLAEGKGCTRCGRWGMRCFAWVNQEELLVPHRRWAGTGSLSSNLRFVTCGPCGQNGRHCDRQRPCDSCVNHGEERACGNAKGVRGCFNRGLCPVDEVYYLAIGYGPDGVNSDRPPDRPDLPGPFSDVNFGLHPSNWLHPRPEVLDPIADSDMWRGVPLYSKFSNTSPPSQGLQYPPMAGQFIQANPPLAQPSNPYYQTGLQYPPQFNNPPSQTSSPAPQPAEPALEADDPNLLAALLDPGLVDIDPQDPQAAAYLRQTGAASPQVPFSPGPCSGPDPPAGFAAVSPAGQPQDGAGSVLAPTPPGATDMQQQQQQQQQDLPPLPVPPPPTTPGTSLSPGALAGESDNLLAEFMTFDEFNAPLMLDGSDDGLGNDFDFGLPRVSGEEGSSAGQPGSAEADDDIVMTDNDPEEPSGSGTLPEEVLTDQKTQDDPPESFFPGWDVLTNQFGREVTADNSADTTTSRFAKYNLGGPGVVFNINYGGLDRPASPQPYDPMLRYSDHETVPDPNQAEDDPERVRHELLKADPGAYPGRDPLVSVPLISAFPAGFRQTLVGSACHEPREAVFGTIIRCERETQDCCEDRQHHIAVPFMVCTETTADGEGCSARSRRIVVEPPDGLTVHELGMMRSWVCSQCVGSGAVDRTAWVNSGRRVWGYVEDFEAQPSGDNNDNNNNTLATGGSPANGAGASPSGGAGAGYGSATRWMIDADGNPAIYGGFMGQALLQGSGCACMTKLVDRTLCQGHRFEHADAILKQTRIMTEWTVAIWGRPVCPLCRERVGVDSYRFQGDKGGDGQAVRAYGCLVCQAFVVLPSSSDPQESFPSVPERQAALVNLVGY